MIIKPSAAIRQNYNEISELCRESGEPVYLTKNGQGGFDCDGHRLPLRAGKAC